MDHSCKNTSKVICAGELILPCCWLCSAGHVHSEHTGPTQTLCNCCNGRMQNLQDAWRAQSNQLVAVFNVECAEHPNRATLMVHKPTWWPAGFSQSDIYVALPWLEQCHSTALSRTHSGLSYASRMYYFAADLCQWAQSTECIGFSKPCMHPEPFPTAAAPG